MRIRHFASRVLRLATAALLFAAGTAAAGDYAPKHLRAESFLRLESDTLSPGPDWSEPYPASHLPFHVPTRLAYAHPLRFRANEMMLRLEAKPGLRRIVRVELRF
jgi:hypothetical protein